MSESKSSVSVRIVRPEPLPPPPDVVEVTLKLSRRDAVAVLAVCSHIGGDYCNTSRSVFEDLNRALKAQGVSTDEFRWVSWGSVADPNPYSPINHLDRGIYLKAYA